MASIERRLMRLEVEQCAIEQARVDAQVTAFNVWLSANASPIEDDAWGRFLLSLPIDADQLRAIGVTQAEHAEILQQAGPFMPEDEALLTALWQRVPIDLKTFLGGDWHGNNE